VLLFVRAADDEEEGFLAAYDDIRHRVASVPGHLSDQLCQSCDDPQQWLITSEWETREHYEAWARTDIPDQLGRTIVARSSERRHVRYEVRRHTANGSL
jgi:heme-degrading monooxygenase HmoA